MSRIAARLRPSQRVGDTIQSQADLAMLFMVGPGRAGGPWVTPRIDDPNNTMEFGGDQTVFVKVTDIADWDHVSVGENAVAAIRKGKLFVWGQGVQNTLGLDGLFNVEVPTELLPGGEWTDVFYGSRHIGGIRDGELYMWGNNQNGRTGRGLTSGTTAVPTQVGSENNWSRIGLGDFHSLAVNADGELYAWGLQANGRLGDGETGSTAQTTPVKIGTDTDWVVAQGGNNHSNALKTDGTLWGTGERRRSGLTSNASTFTQVGTDTDWVTWGSGQRHSMGIRGNTVVAWGSREFGQTGENTAFGNTATPTAVVTTNLTGTPIDAAGVDQASIVITTDGVFATGRNINGRTGQGTTEGNTLILTRVAGPVGTGVFEKIARGGTNRGNAVLKRKKV